MAVFLAGDFDEDVSDWAVDGNPLFGSDSTARSFSNVGRDLLRYSSLATSSFKKGKGTGRLQFDRKGAKEWLLTWSSAQIMTASLKAAVGRERPDMENNRSFPSGHSSGALVSTSILRRNLDNGSHLRAYDGARSLLNFGICSLAGAVAWARVEGEKHYPSDVLAGAAIGNAFGNFYFDLFPSSPNEKTRCRNQPLLFLSEWRSRPHPPFTFLIVSLEIPRNFQTLYS